MAERGFLAGLDGGCQTPMAAHAVIKNGVLTLEALLCDLAGKRAYRETTTMSATAGPDAAYRAGYELAEKIKRAGGERLLSEILAAAYA